MQRVPISITAVDGATLAQAHVSDLIEMKRLAPTFRFNPTSGTGVTGARLSIRGVGTFTNSAIEPSVGTFLDGVYIPRPASIGRTFLDIEAVEVISGPQGTLFGRNASAGALSLRSATPKPTFSAAFTGSYETGADYKGVGYVNIPVSSTTAIRLAGLVEDFGGYWRNTLDGRRFGGVNNYSGRISLKTEFSSSLSLVLRGDYTKQTGIATNNWKLRPETLTPVTLARLTAVQGGIVPPLDEYGRNNSFYMGEYDIDAHHWGVSSNLQWAPGGGFDVNLISSYRDWQTKQSDGDVAILAVPVIGRDQYWRSKSYSNELQIISPSDRLLDGRLSFVAGLYQFHEDLAITYTTNLLSEFCRIIGGAVRPAAVPACLAAPLRGAVNIPYVQSTNSLAAYGQLTYALVPKLLLTLGGRVTQDRKSALSTTVVNNPLGVLFGAPEVTKLYRKDSRFTGRVTLNWQPTDQLSLFGTYSTGFKSGGFNNNGSTVVLGQGRAYDPEDVKNLEFGFKSTLFDRALVFNATAYRMHIDNLQDRSVDPSGINSIRNVGRLRHQGVEVQAIVRPTSWLRLNGNVAYLDAKFLSYPRAPQVPWRTGVQDLTGTTPNYAPKWAGTVGPEVTLPAGSSGMRVNLRSDLSFFSRQNVGAVQDHSPVFIQSGYALLSGRAELSGPGERWSVAVFGQNLTNKGYCDDTLYQVFEGPLGLRLPDRTAARCSVGTPRRIGMSGSVKF